MVSKVIAGCMHWGTWGANLDPVALLKNINGCLKLGITSFDHADIYGHYTTELQFGEVLKYLNIRKDIQLISKCGIKLLSPNKPEHIVKHYDCSAAHIIKSVEQSLRNLHTDYLDVLLLHRPDILLNPNEVAIAFDQLKQSGKVLKFGVSNFNVQQMQLLRKFVHIEYNQIEISPLATQSFTDGVIDYCYENEIELMAWSPMKGGKIYEHNGLNELITQLSDQYKCSKDAIVYAWIYKHPAQIKVVTGTSKLERLEYAVAASQIELTQQDWYQIYSTAIGAEVA